MIAPMTFIVAAFATFYAADAIAQRDGPFGLFDKLRARWDEGYLGKGVRCVICVSAYTAFVWAVLLGVLGKYDAWLWPVVWLGLAGASVLISRIWAR